MNVQEYIKVIDEQYQTGIAHEHSYRFALQQLLSEMLPHFIVTNEPKRFDFGIPDIIITQKKGAKQPVFFVETKDLFDNDLDGLHRNKEQFDRYKSSLDFIVFTDYLDFHVYEHGQFTENIRIGEIKGNHIKPILTAVERFSQLINRLSLSEPMPITSAQRLAEQMAAKAKLLAIVVRKVLEQSDNEDCYENKSSQLNDQLEALKMSLIHDLTPKDFADIYAQTVAYGMFAARLHDDTPEDFTRQEAATLIPKTNPFLRQIFQQIAGYDLDSRIVWIVEDLAHMFLSTNVEKVMETYGSNEQHSDPMIHFYEDFLSAYDSNLRKAKGVWYTPLPIVRFIVRSVDEILQSDFNLPMGLADYSKIEHEIVNDQYERKKRKSGDKMLKKTVHRVQILDPATGTGTFLAEVIRQIYNKFEGQHGSWQGYVEDHLLPRLHGFELLMASYAMAHLKLDMQLRNLGYDSVRSNNKRLGVYLTNSLEEYNPYTGTIWAEWLASEAKAANRIKRDTPVMVMIGNPPYSVSSSNNSEWITNLIYDYKQNLNERNIQPLSDDYIKFIRLGQDYVERNNQGILAYISNNSFIDGIIHREMRHRLLFAFDDIYIINLHGNARKREVAPDGSKDENVFDIMQGVSINIFVRKPGHKDSKLGHVFYSDLFGSREHKYEYLASNSLVDSIEWKELSVAEPNYFFVPKDFGAQEEYSRGIRIDELLPFNASGIKTQKDKACISITENEISILRNDFTTLDVNDIYSKYHFEDTRDWTIAAAKNDIIHNHLIDVKCFYRIFDERYMLYTGTTKGVMGYPRFNINKNMLKNNISLVVCRQQSSFDFQHVFITKLIADMCCVSSQTKEGAYVFPLHLYTTAIDGTEEKTPNLNREEWDKFNVAVGRVVSPEELLHYIYGVLHSPSYRERYKEFLKIDFPRIPLPNDESKFLHFADFGKQLIELHLMRNADTWKLEAQYNVHGTDLIEYLRYEDDNVWINDNQYFSNVPLTAWNAYIGGYQPAQKWLKDRKGRKLTFDDIRHYLRIVYVLTATQSLMTEIG